MGSFFANLHVKTDGPDPRGAIVAVSDLVTAHLLEKGYQTAGSESEAPPDRRIVLASAGDGWVALYDEESDAPDPSALADLGRAVSRATLAIGAIVSDSDCLELSLFQNGRRTDRLRYEPGVSTPRPKRAWSAVLGDSLPAFLSSFSAASAFAEEPLEVLASALRISPDSIHLGFRYRDELVSPEKATLQFLEPAGSHFYAARSGPPSYRHYAGLQKVRLVSGRSSDGFGFLASFYNEGGPSQGASVLLETTPAQESVFPVQSLRLYLDGGLDRTLDAEVVRVTTEDRQFYRARLPALELPPWIDATRDMRPAEYVRLNRVFQRAQIQVQVVGVPTAPGFFATRLIFVPHSNQEGLAVAEFEVTVEAQQWWP